MRKIGDTIIEEGIPQTQAMKERNTVRAVITNDDKVLMLYSDKYDDYTFPGGGIKDGEGLETALQRELNEEIGVSKFKIISDVGYTVEHRFGLREDNQVYRQVSYYFLCDVLKYEEAKLVGREKHQGLKTLWVEIDEAINYNLKTNLLRVGENAKGFKTVLIRENLVLKYLQKNIKNKSLDNINV